MGQPAHFPGGLRELERQQGLGAHPSTRITTCLPPTWLPHRPLHPDPSPELHLGRREQPLPPSEPIVCIPKGGLGFRAGKPDAQPECSADGTGHRLPPRDQGRRVRKGQLWQHSGHCHLGNPVIGRPGLPTLSSQPGLPQALLTRAAMLSSPSISSAENLLSLHAKRALAGRGCFHQEPGQINPAKLPPQWNRWDVRTLPSAQASCSSPLSWEGAPGPQSPLLGNEEYSRKTTAMALQIGWPLETTG